jgi:hypothetical protein
MNDLIIVEMSEKTIAVSARLKINSYKFSSIKCFENSSNGIDSI